MKQAALSSTATQIFLKLRGKKKNQVAEERLPLVCCAEMWHIFHRKDYFVIPINARNLFREKKPYVK